MKRLLVLVTVMVAVFGFSAGAFAAWGDPICTSCTETVEKTTYACELRNIDCPEEQAPCAAFDYDGGYGYCTGNTLPCKLIFNICNCEDPTNFEAGQTIGIKMTILVDGVAGENGAYWSEGANANVAFDAHPSALEACADTTEDRTFGPGKFFRYSDGAQVTTLIGNPVCTVPLANQATVILTDIDAGYQISSADELAKVSHWWIDVAPIRTDPAVVQAGQVISVLVQLLNQESGGICADCTPVCECVIDVAIVCCEEPAVANCIYFPYVLPGVTGWGTGIVVSNLTSSSVPAAAMEVTFTLTDYTGAVFTYTKSDFTSVVWSDWLNNILPEFSGTPAIGAGWLKVDANFGVDGYQFMTDGTFGAGTQPRPCAWPCPCPYPNS